MYFKFTLTILMYRDRSKDVAKRKRSESIRAPVTQTHRKEEEEASSSKGLHCHLEFSRWSVGIDAGL